MFDDSNGHNQNKTYVIPIFIFLFQIENIISRVVLSIVYYCIVVSQAGRAASDQAYKGILDCAVRVFRDEGAITFYRGLPPRSSYIIPILY